MGRERTGGIWDDLVRRWRRSGVESGLSPSYVCAVKIVKELDETEVASALHRRRRMAVLERDDGHFTLAEQYHYATDVDGKVVAEGWATLPSEGIFATAEEAEAEARLAIGRWGL